MIKVHNMHIYKYNNETPHFGQIIYANIKNSYNEYLPSHLKNAIQDNISTKG
jgi:hypothetical protein